MGCNKAREAMLRELEILKQLEELGEHILRPDSIPRLVYSSMGLRSELGITPVGTPLLKQLPTMSGQRKGESSEQHQKSLTPPRAPGIRFAEQPRIPTKDERLAADEKEEKEKPKGLAKLRWKK